MTETLSGKPKSVIYTKSLDMDIPTIAARGVEHVFSTVVTTLPKVTQLIQGIEFALARTVCSYKKEKLYAVVDLDLVRETLEEDYMQSNEFMTRVVHGFAPIGTIKGVPIYVDPHWTLMEHLDHFEVYTEEEFSEKYLGRML